MATSNALLTKSGVKNAFSVGLCDSKKEVSHTSMKLLRLFDIGVEVKGCSDSRPSGRRGSGFVCGALHLVHRESPVLLSQGREEEQANCLIAGSQVLAQERSRGSNLAIVGLAAGLQAGLDKSGAEVVEASGVIPESTLGSKASLVKATRSSSKVGTKLRDAKAKSRAKSAKLSVDDGTCKHLGDSCDCSRFIVEKSWQEELADRTSAGAGDPEAALPSGQCPVSLMEAEIQQIERGLNSLVGAVSLQEAYSSSVQCTSLEGSDLVSHTRGPKSQRRRLTLKARVALKRQQQEKQAGGGGGVEYSAGDEVLQRGRESAILSTEVPGKGLSGIQLEGDEEELLQKYGAAAQLFIGDWERIEKHRLLGVLEEKWLTKLIAPLKNLEKTGKRLESKLQRPPSESEWAAAAHMRPEELRRKLALGQAARNKLLMHNLRLVVWMASKFAKMSPRSIEYSDLCQQGIMGLIEGAASFDPARGLRFSTYITFWVRTAIMRFITKHGNTLRAPIHMGMEKLNISRARGDLTRELGRPAKDAEVIQRLRMREDRFRAVRDAFRPVASLNVPHRSTGLEVIQSVVAVGGESNDVLSLEERFKADPLLRIDFDDVLDSLKPRESLVLRQRFGLDGRGFKSQVEIGRNLNLSKQMVNKYQDRALNKMRHPERLEHLRKFLTLSN